MITIPVTTDRQVEQMRVIRNACRAFMTRVSDEITPNMQKLWWAELDKDKVATWLHYMEVEPIGYSLARLRDSGWWVTGGLIEEYRGKGLGRQIFQRLLSHAQMDKRACWLEVLDTNMRAYKLYESLGFVETRRFSGVITMVKAK